MKSAFFVLGLFMLATCGCGDTNPQVTRARLAMKNLEKAVMAYKSTYGYPDKLETLTDDKANAAGALLPASALIDPWGRPFQYDPSQLHPETELPLIWSEGPNPGQPGSKIESWSVKDE